MNFVYLRCQGEWDDMVIILKKKDAISESLTYPNIRIEIFAKGKNGYTPTYNYYKNGKLYINIYKKL